MQVEFWVDVVCPWCYIGKARFDKALAIFEHGADVEVVHRSFELDPGRAVNDDEPVSEMPARRYGPQARKMEDNVAGLAREEGLEYRLDRLVGGTFDVHRLLHLAGEHGVRNELTELVLHTNFARALPLFTNEVLVDLTAEAGLDRTEARKVLEQPAIYAEAVRTEERRAHELGAIGVPFILMDGSVAVAGARPVLTLVQSLQLAWASMAR
ncbi:protein-disulfide isomerase [Lentzea guizhouensis]|uniref:Protein-disulfide isomerase n=1 Tax=Lentzea guizhouensis TaxID=1586287 RepID=A0A1B2HT59_9PSEU|nr:DsbA family oxidoreductase [Lentzea guizhouensis]ANZ40917.1 protein-disulfide isomerase [Lentzea guizhouensis]